MKFSWINASVSLAVFLFLYAPLAVVVLFSFNNAPHGAVWRGFTTRWYPTLLKNDQALDAAWNTLLLAFSSTVIATVLGTMLGFAQARYLTRGQAFVRWIMHLPVFIPDIVMAVSLLLFYALIRQATGWMQLGLGTMILAHVTFQIPFVAIVVKARLANIDPAFEEAARDLGAGTRQTFFHVTLPLIRPGVLAGALLAFTLSLDDFVISFFTAGPGSTTLPILIYSSVKRGISPDINALSSLLIVASFSGILLLTILQKRTNRR